MIKIVNSKRLIITTSILATTIVTLLVIVINSFSANKEIQVSDDIINQIAENIVSDGEFIDIYELEGQEENLVNTNTINTTSKEQQNNKTINSEMKYYIRVNYGAQTVTIYMKDEEGNYTKPVKAMVCSTGVATPTSGVYAIPARWEWLGLQGDVYGHYCTQIKGNILFHSVPYLTRYDPASLEYWEYDKLGTYASAGCIRLTIRDAKWIYENCAKGTLVEFYSDSNPGPLGKPSAMKISSYSDELRNWDPTDPNPENPWNNRKKEEDNNQNNNQNNKDDEEKNTVNENNIIPENIIIDDNTNTVNNINTDTNQNNIPESNVQNNLIDNTIDNTQSNNIED